MDTLIAKYYTPQDDFFDDEDSSMQFQSTKPSLDLKFSLPPIAQVHRQIYLSSRVVLKLRDLDTDITTHRDSQVRSSVL